MVIETFNGLNGSQDREYDEYPAISCRFCPGDMYGAYQGNMALYGLNKREAAMFERFWAIYPKKVAKKEAIKYFDRLTKDQQLSAINKLPDHVAYWNASGTGKEFIPHAGTWLNGERWDDELEMPKAPEKAWWTSEQGMLDKGREYGISPTPGETWDKFKTRVTAKVRAA